MTANAKALNGLRRQLMHTAATPYISLLIEPYLTPREANMNVKNHKLMHDKK
jgi:hypothetical protein